MGTGGFESTNLIRLYSLGRVGDPCILVRFLESKAQQRMRDSKESVKFMQVLDRGIFLRLKQLAKARGVTVQELIRVLVIPDWMRRSDDELRRAESRKRHRRLGTLRGRPTQLLARVRPQQRRN